MEQQPFNLDLPPVSSDDLEQEAALLRLQGVQNPSKRLIHKRLSRAEGIFSEIPLGSAPLWSEEPVPDRNVTEALVDWALQQSDEISDIVFNFLDHPEDQDLDEVIASLKTLGVEIYSFKRKKQSTPRSLTQIIIAELKKHPQTTQALYELARNIQPTRRPEAAVRQILRRLDKSGEVTVSGDLVHYPEE